jgi:hypothetical protein
MTFPSGENIAVFTGPATLFQMILLPPVAQAVGSTLPAGQA